MAVSRLSKVSVSHLFLAPVERETLRSAIHFIPKNRCSQSKKIDEQIFNSNTNSDFVKPILYKLF